MSKLNQDEKVRWDEKEDQCKNFNFMYQAQISQINQITEHHTLANNETTKNKVSIIKNKKVSKSQVGLS